MLTKYTNCEILEVKRTNKKLTGNNKLAAFDHLPKDTYRTDDGYLYVTVRAISSRVNKNWDGWPSVELAGMDNDTFTQLAREASETRTAKVLRSHKISTRGDYGFKTFVGRPIFVDHNNSDPERTRGVIVDSLLHIEDGNRKRSGNDYYASAPDNHKPETWIELLLEVDAKTFPHLAKAFENGDIDSVSMGCNVEETECSICGNRAANVEEYCHHIQNKGQIFSKEAGERANAYEDCYGVNFFEISAVFDPADETALTTGPVIAKVAGHDKWSKVAMDDRYDRAEAYPTDKPSKTDEYDFWDCPRCGETNAIEYYDEEDKTICDWCGYDVATEGEGDSRWSKVAFDLPGRPTPRRAPRNRMEESFGVSPEIHPDQPNLPGMPEAQPEAQMPPAELQAIVDQLNQMAGFPPGRQPGQEQMFDPGPRQQRPRTPYPAIRAKVAQLQDILNKLNTQHKLAKLKGR